MEFVPKPPPGICRRSSGGIPAEGKPKEEEALPPLAQGKKGKQHPAPFQGTSHQLEMGNPLLNISQGL